MKYKVVYPILGFEDEKEFDLTNIEGAFYKLEGKNSSFTLIDPFFLRNDYDFEIDYKIAHSLKLNANNVMVLNILTLEKPFENSTVNFAGPVIFNRDEKLMGQVVLDKYNYSLARPLKDFIGDKSES